MLKVSGIAVYYGDMQALRNVSIDVNQGEVVSVIGSNGAGKSTLLKTISGMLRTRTGSISLNGNEISQAQPSKIVENGISHVPEGRQIFPTMTVLKTWRWEPSFPAPKKYSMKPCSRCSAISRGSRSASARKPVRSVEGNSRCWLWAVV